MELGRQGTQDSAAKDTEEDFQSCSQRGKKTGKVCLKGGGAF